MRSENLYTIYKNLCWRYLLKVSIAVQRLFFYIHLFWTRLKIRAYTYYTIKIVNLQFECIFILKSVIQIYFSQVIHFLVNVSRRAINISLFWWSKIATQTVLLPQYHLRQFKNVSKHFCKTNHSFSSVVKSYLYANRRRCLSSECHY